VASDVAEFVRYQIANAELRRYPFPHFYVRPVFPDDFYRELLSKLPPAEALTPIHETGTVGIVDPNTGATRAVYEPRHIADLSALEEDESARGTGQLWRELAAWLMDEPFRDLLMEKFGAAIVERFGDGVRLVTDVEARFVRDFTSYKIPPHTDQPAKLVSLLFYLPADESLSPHGTSIYRPHDPALRCEGTARHDFSRFSRVATMPFLPNALFGFFKTDHSFHGVEAIRADGVERNALLYNIYARKAVRTTIAPAAARNSRLWPWSRRAASR
jgi:hypothetical protein